MVGVPGRSGGCVTCRRRKKGCDKNSPFCGQCVQAGLVCEGYNGHHSIWVNSVDGEKRRYVKASVPMRSCTDSPPNITLNDSLTRSAREDRFVGLYLAAYLPNGRLFSRHASKISSVGWLRYHDALSRSEKTLRLITLAHGLSMLATRDNDSQLKFKGFQAHRMALQEMRYALQDPQRATGDGILAAVRLFRFYGILYGAESDGINRANPNIQVKGYYAHTEGEMAMFMSRGCDKDWSQAGRHLLSSGRIVSFILGVCQRKRSPFDDSQWLTAPWKDITKSPLDELTDIMVQIPGLLERLDSIRDSPEAENCSKAWKDLLDQCVRIEQALLAWKNTMRDDISDFEYSPYGKPLLTPQIDRDFAVLHLSYFYWSCSIILYTTIHIAATEASRWTIDLPCSPIPFSSHGYPKYEDERNPTLHAHRIVHALPLSYTPHGGGYAALDTAFPLGLALRYLVVAHLFPHEGNSGNAQRLLLQETLSKPFMGAYVARFLENLMKVDAPVQGLKDIPGWHGVESRARRFWFGPLTGKKLRAAYANQEDV